MDSLSLCLSLSLSPSIVEGWRGPRSAEELPANHRKPSGGRNQESQESNPDDSVECAKESQALFEHCRRLSAQDGDDAKGYEKADNSSL